MQEDDFSRIYGQYRDTRNYRFKNRYFLHISLFLVTFFTTTVAGVAWLNIDPFALENLSFGLTYSTLLLTVLTFHEFGHYFASRFHGIHATLPFYIPFPPLPGVINFGTLGAIIRIRAAIPNKKILFDIGIAGPIAGFVVSVAILIYGMINLPDLEYLYNIHPEYRGMAELPEGNLIFGSTLMLELLKEIFVARDAFFPPMNEIYHYPFLTVGWFGMLITALNLLPVGQLDGGHISYAMFGDTHILLARVVFVLLLFLGISGLLPLLGFNLSFGWAGWLMWAGILYFFIKLKHPPVADSSPLDTRRVRLGWSAFIILALCFSPVPLSLQL